MYKEDAHEKIKYIFNSIEHEDKSNAWKLDELQKVLSELQDTQYKRGIKKGYDEAISILNNYKPTN